MGVKISSLPINTLPYTGSEEIPLVQSGETRAGTLSSFVNYLSGTLGSGSIDTGVRSLSGNWQNTYTTYSANSANYAVKNADNNFTNTQTISVINTTKVKFGSNYKAKIDPNTANIQFGYDSTDTTSGTYNISIGVKANSSGTSNIVIGTQDSSVFNSDNNIAIGTNIFNYNNAAIAVNNEKNILIGSGAKIQDNSGGVTSNNIVIGTNSETYGYDNVVIGNTALTYGYSSCIVLGKDATPTQDNQLVIGGVAVDYGTITPDHYMTVSINGSPYRLPLEQVI